MVNGKKRSKEYRDRKKLMKLQRELQQFGEHLNELAKLRNASQTHNTNNDAQLVNENEISSDSDESNEFDESKPKLFQELADWIVNCQIPYEAADKLLKILQPRIPTLPLCTKTLLKNYATKVKIENMQVGDGSDGEVNTQVYNTRVLEHMKTEENDAEPSTSGQVSTKAGNSCSFPLESMSTLDSDIGIHHMSCNVESMEEITVPVIDMNNIGCRSNFEVAVLSKMANIRSELQHIAYKQDEMIRFLVDKQVETISRSIDFSQKYNIVLPFDEKEIFLQFDEEIRKNPSLKSDVCTELKQHMDKNFSISKSFLRMLRTFITKNVAMKFTASRQSKDKENPKDRLKTTEFYNCMESVVLSVRNSKNFETSPKDLISSLSDVLSNARCWDRSKKSVGS